MLKQEDIAYNRHIRNIPQKQFAKQLGITASYLSQIENGKTLATDTILDKVMYQLSKHDADNKVKNELQVIEPRTAETVVEEFEQAKAEYEAKPESTETLIRQQCDELAEILIKKNHDYGDSFHKTYEAFGDMSTFIRLQDKMGRLESMIQGKEMQVEEAKEDVFRDIAGYSILALVSKQKG